MYLLKHAALILLVSFSKVLAQIGPPDLRCLEVLPNGNVSLTWTPVSDPGNNFAYYKVYSHYQKIGPYSAVSPTISPVTATGMLHATNAGSAQTTFYYVRTFQLNGDSSKASDTLQTIFLNVIPAATLDISYNNTSNPPRSNGGVTFTVTKEYPIGSVNVFSVTTSTKAADVISVCNEKINYRVLLKDGSGCISKSNTIFGNYDDLSFPEMTDVDSISVLEDGRTILSWVVAKEADVDTYNILKKTNGITNIIDQVSGRMSTSYIFNDMEANTRPVQLFVNAQDSCADNPSTYDERPVTMHLRPEYDYCRYRTNLSWNPYQGLKKGIKEYRIYYAVNGGTYTLLGTTQGNTYSHDGVDPKANVCYFVRVVNTDASITASSNRSCFFTQEVGVPGFFYVRSASVNRDQDVDINIAIDTLIRFAEIEIQRSQFPSSEFAKIASLKYDAGSNYAYRDLDAETDARPYYYKAILRDSCGNARKESNLCRTIFLQAGDAGEDLFKRRLTWTAYEGFAGGVEKYNIYRIVNDDPGPPVIATTNGNVTTYTDNLEDVAENGSSIAYVVQAVEAGTSPYPYKDFAGSNKAEVYVEGRIYVPNAFAPNGINRIWKPVTHFVDKNEYNVRVFNRWGKQVFRADEDVSGWDGAGCPEDVYVYLISYKNARGEYREQKGTIMLMK